jgi:N-acetylmuramoyl-L-alanine amidase
VPELIDGDRLEVETDWTQVRFAGHTDPEARLRLNGEEIRVWPTGAFAGRLENLEVGEHPFTFEAERENETAIRTIHVVRPAPRHPLPPSPAVIDEDSVRPEAPLMVAPADELRVSFRGSVGGHASATLGARNRVRMTEDPDDPGLYRGIHRVTGDEGWSEDELTVRLAVDEGEPARVEITVPRLLWNLDPDRPPVLEVRSPDRHHAPVYPDTAQSSRLTDLPEGTRLLVWGQRDHHWRVRLAPGEFAWVPVNGDETFTRRMPRGTPPPRGALTDLAVREVSGATLVELDLEQPLPARVIERPDSSEIELRLFGLIRAPEARPMDLPLGLVDRMHWETRGEEIQGLIITRRGVLWGWDLTWEGRTLALRLDAAPSLSQPPQSPLQGLRIVLDPGHGGDDPGAIGSTGLTEKETNLALSRRVRRLLADRGAEVFLLRDDDRAIDLNARVRETRALRPHLCVSVHSNSVALTIDPLTRQGVSVYTSHPHGEDLARTILERLLATGGLDDDGLHRRNFRVTRPSQWPSVLVELLYLSHPEDEAKLLDERWQSRLAAAVASGVEDWARSRRDQQNVTNSRP